MVDAPPYPSAVFQARVSAAIVHLEAVRDGAVCPIRAVPLDMVAAAVARDLGVTSALAESLVPDEILVRATAALVARYVGTPEAQPVRTDPESLLVNPAPLT